MWVFQNKNRMSISLVNRFPVADYTNR